MRRGPPTSISSWSGGKFAGEPRTHGAPFRPAIGMMGTPTLLRGEEAQRDRDSGTLRASDAGGGACATAGGARIHAILRGRVRSGIAAQVSALQRGDLKRPGVAPGSDQGQFHLLAAAKGLCHRLPLLPRDHLRRARRHADTSGLGCCQVLLSGPRIRGDGGAAGPSGGSFPLVTTTTRIPQPGG